MLGIYEEIRKRVLDHHDWIHSKFREIAQKETSPHEVAIGFSIGLFAALATPGIDVIVVLFLILAFRLHRLAVLFGVAIIDNPISLAIIYPLSFQLGSVIVGYEPLQNADFFSLHNLLNVSKPLLVGNFILALLLSFLAYFIVYYVYYYVHYRKRLSKPL